MFVAWYWLANAFIAMFVTSLVVGYACVGEGLKTGAQAMFLVGIGSMLGFAFCKVRYNECKEKES